MQTQDFCAHEPVGIGGLLDAGWNASGEWLAVARGAVRFWASVGTIRWRWVCRNPEA
jgi:hypothetical protein